MKIQLHINNNKAKKCKVNEYTNTCILTLFLKSLYTTSWPDLLFLCQIYQMYRCACRFQRHVVVLDQSGGGGSALPDGLRAVRDDVPASDSLGWRTGPV